MVLLALTSRIVIDAAAAGLLTGLSLIVAIGAQNAYVLRQGLTREQVGVVVTICAGSDLVLILAGVMGIGAVAQRAPTVLEVVRWIGVAFLMWFGVAALLRARRASSLRAAGAGTPSRQAAAVRAAAFTWLNPHVYLDTVVLLGSVASHEGSTGRWWFAAGAGMASVLWFSGIGYGARLAAPALASPRAWRLLDVLVGLTMLVVAARLARG
jgi:L-lysine exporter family protein LysE/ArgO